MTGSGLVEQGINIFRAFCLKKVLFFTNFYLSVSLRREFEGARFRAPRLLIPWEVNCKHCRSPELTRF